MNFHYFPLFFLFPLAMFLSANAQSEDPLPPPIPEAFADCFDQFPQRALSNAAPAGEFYNVSPEDCLRFCARDHFCHTMVYHRHFSTCQLYSGAKEGERAVDVGAKGHDLYSRKGAECGGNGEAKRDPKKEEEQKRPKGGGGEQQR